MPTQTGHTERPVREREMDREREENMDRKSRECLMLSRATISITLHVITYSIWGIWWTERKLLN